MVGQRSGVPVALVDNGGFTIAHVAAMYGHLPFLRNIYSYFLNADAFASFLSIPDGRGCSLLHRAALRGDSKMVRWLFEGIEFGVCNIISDVDAVDDIGNTPLHVAFFLGSPNSFVVDYLLKRGAKVDVRNQKGELPLHGLMCTEYVGFLDRLSAGGKLLSEQDANGNTLLMEVALFDGMDNRLMVQALIASGGHTVNWCNNFGITALHFAVHKGNVGVFSDLLRAGADLDAVDGCGSTPWQMVLSSSKKEEFLSAIEEVGYDENSPYLCQLVLRSRLRDSLVGAGVGM